MVELVDAEGPPEDVGFATVSPLADISSQVILGSRIITRDLSKMKDTGAIFGLDVPMYQQFNKDFYDVADELNGAASPEQMTDIFIYIYAENSTAIKRRILLERWEMKYNPKERNSDGGSIMEMPESVQLLRTIVCTSRILPAFTLHKKFLHTPDEFSLHYKISSALSPSIFFNTGEIATCKLPKVQSRLGSFQVLVEYRKNCTIYSEPIPLQINTLDASYYPQSQVFKRDEKDDGQKVKNDSESSKDDIKSVEISNPNDIIHSHTVPNDSSPEFFSCVSTTVDVEHLLESCHGSLSGVFEESMQVSPELKEFQRMVNDLQELNMFNRQKATYQKSSLQDLERFCTGIADLLHQ